MKKMLILTVALALGACQDRYGRTDPVRTGLLGAAIGGGAGLLGGAVAQSNERPRYGYGYGYPGGGYQQPYNQRPYWGRYGY